jgi:hypothetical protein
LETHPTEISIDAALGSQKAAECILPIVWTRAKFESVVDVGCGSGVWLPTAQKLGASRVLGIDQLQNANQFHSIDPKFIQIHDLEQPLSINERFDLCICLEVAEHLSPTRAPGLISDLVSLSDVVLFSAAIPFQGGHHHVNEQWPEFWAELFAQHGFLAWDGIRNQIWQNMEIPWWYRQNIMLFVQSSIWEELCPGSSSANPRRLSLVHPECFLWTKPGSARLSRLKELQILWGAH